MTREETTQIILKLHGAYFSQDRFVDSRDFEARINIWDAYFKDFTYAVVNQAITEWIGSKSTMPQISELLPRCKDLRDIESCPKDDPMNWKSTAEMVWDARHGELKDEDIPEWITKATDDLVKWLRSDPKMRAKFDKENSDLGSSALPYEI